MITETDTEKLIKLLSYERDKFLNERDLAIKERDEALLQLLAIGDIAVADWDAKTVGAVDAVVKEPVKYKDRLRKLFVDIPRERDQLRERVRWLSSILSGGYAQGSNGLVVNRQLVKEALAETEPKGEA